jgi:hypothetical protein
VKLTLISANIGDIRKICALGADYAGTQSSLIWSICANPAVDAAARTLHIGCSTQFGERDQRGE